jgi:hypothetical protein
VIKTLIILILMVLLCGGAFLSRPSFDDFKTFYARQWEQSNPDFLSKIASPRRPDAFLGDVTLKDRYLWVTIVRKDGSTAYVGAFGNFWETGQKGKEVILPETKKI